MDDKAKGAWIVHHTHKLDSFKSVDHYSNLHVAGKSGILLSALSTTDQSSLETSQVDALATAAGINLAFELPRILDVLSSANLIERSSTGIEILGLTTPTVLSHTSGLLDRLEPTPLELASIEAAELCSHKPYSDDDLLHDLHGAVGLPSSDLSKLLSDARDLGFTDFESVDGSSHIYFNGNLFRVEDTRKVHAVSASLSSDEERRIAEVDAALRSSGCVLLADAKSILTAPLFSKLHSISMYDVLTVSNSTDTAAFITRPSAFSKYGPSTVDDAFDLAKALVASITYGMNRRNYSTGRITQVGSLLRKLIYGSWVGPATAIGEDYKILELKRVIEVRRQGHLFSMRLLKREVGELALQVITQGDASENSLPSFPGASVTKFVRPEEARTSTRQKLQRTDKIDVTSVLDQLRTGL